MDNQQLSVLNKDKSSETISKESTWIGKSLETVGIAKGKIIIYTLDCPITGQIRYVGKTSQLPIKRYICHYNKRTRTYVSSWIESLKKKNFKPIMNLLDVVDEETWDFWEKYWISQCKSWDFKLTNISAGGKGVKRPVSEETKAFLLKFAKERVWTEKQRKIISENIKQYYAKQREKGGYKYQQPKFKKEKYVCTEEHRKNLSISHKNQKISKETLQKLIAKNKKPILQYSLNDKFIKEWDSAVLASKELKINASFLRHCLLGDKKQAGGFKWKYAIKI